MDALSVNNNTLAPTAQPLQAGIMTKKSDFSSDFSALFLDDSDVNGMLRKMIDFGAITPDEAKGLSRTCETLSDLEQRLVHTANLNDPNNPAAVFHRIRDWIQLPNGALVPKESADFYSKLTAADIDMIFAATGMDARKGQLHFSLGDIALHRNNGDITNKSLDNSDIDLIRSMYARDFDFSNPGADQQRITILNELFEGLYKKAEENKNHLQASVTSQRTEFENRVIH